MGAALSLVVTWGPVCWRGARRLQVRPVLAFVHLAPHAGKRMLSSVGLEGVGSEYGVSSMWSQRRSQPPDPPSPGPVRGRPANRCTSEGLERRRVGRSQNR